MAERVVGTGSFGTVFQVANIKYFVQAQNVMNIN
jgi:hypothetical protein